MPIAVDPRSRAWASPLVLLLAVLLAPVTCAAPEPGRDGRTAKAQQAAVAPPRVSSEFALGPAALLARRDVPIVAAAPGPNGYLLVHDLLAESVDGSSLHRVLATRILLDGTVLDPGGILIGTSTAPANAFAARAAYTGAGWLVVYSAPELTSVTLGTNGVVGATTPLGLNALEGLPGGLVWGVDSALATTTAGRGLFLNVNGTPIGASFQIFNHSSTAPGYVSGGNVAFNGSAFLARYSWAPTNPAANAPALLVFSITAAGSTGQRALVNGALPPNTSPIGLEVVSNGATFMVTYMMPVSAIQHRIQFRIATVAATGEIALGAPVAPSVDPVTNIVTRAVFVNGNYLLYARAHALRVDSAGTPLGPAEPLLLDVSNRFYAELTNSTFFLVPALDGANLLAYSGHLAIRVSPALAAEDEPPLRPLPLPTHQIKPAVAFAAGRYVVAWEEHAAGVRFTSVAPTDAILHAPRRLVAEGFEPLAVTNGTDVLVTWANRDRAIADAARIAPDGSLTDVDLAGLGSPYITQAALTSDGADYFLEWRTPTQANPDLPPSSRATIMSASGVLSAPVTLAPPGGDADVAFDGENYVVAWSQRSAPGTQEIVATRVSRSLTVIDSSPRALLSYPESLFELGPRLASAGDGVLVAWSEGNESGAVSTVRAVRVARDLTLVGGAVTLGTTAFPTFGIVTAWDGASYWLVWQDLRELFGRRLGPDGALVDAQSLPIADGLAFTNLTNRNVALAPGANGQLLVAYPRHEEVAHRLMARLLGPEPNGDGGAGGGAGTDAGGSAGETSGGTSGTATGGAAGDGAGAAGDGAGAAGGGGAAAGTSSGGNAGSVGGSAGATAGVSGGGSGNSAGSAGGGEDDDSGCGCSLPGRSPNARALWLAALVAALAFRRSTREGGSAGRR